MAFITATWKATGMPIHINVSHIVAVSFEGGSTVIYTTVPDADGAPYQFEVLELEESIMTKIKVSTAR